MRRLLLVTIRRVAPAEPVRTILARLASEAAALSRELWEDIES